MKCSEKKMRGWRLARYIERRRYYLYCGKLNRRRKRHGHERKRLRKRLFEIKQEEEMVAKVCGKRCYIDVGGLRIVCPKGSVIIHLPQIFDFEKNYHESALVVSVFRRAVENKVRIAYINFERVKQISPTCIMVFMAYADMWKSYARSIQTKTQTWDPAVVRAFDEIGFFSILGFKHPCCAYPRVAGRTYMPIIANNVYLSGSVDVGHLTIAIQKQIEEFFKINLEGVRLYDSVTEAISNVYGHAYKNIRMGNLPFRWWMSVSYDVNISELGVILFDHGHGIPSTMKHSTKFDLYRSVVNRLGGEWSEHFRLSVAFERERRKNRGNISIVGGRGHGCPDMLRLVSRKDQNEIKEGSRFFVISGRAWYFYEEWKNGGRGISRPLAWKMQGTLIEWRIKL